MRIIQAVFGVFHHFELARELERRGHLQKIYSTWPWRRLKREGLPAGKVESFPWVDMTGIAFARSGLNPRWLSDQLGYWNALSFDEWTSRRIEPCDAFIAISGAGLKTGKQLQERGGVFICDRGSSHQRYQERIVSDEFRRWKVDLPVSDIRDTLREEAIYEAADAITVPSSFAKRSFLEMGVPAHKLHRIPYGVRLQNFRPSIPPAKDRFEVLFAGQVGLRKGFPYLLEAFAKLCHPSKRLRVVGSIQPELESILPRLPQEKVEFLGIVPQPELARLMSSSHVLVLPSIEEGLALVQGQALACGCPVICSTNTGGEDLFTHGKEGYVLPVRDVDAMVEHMQMLVDDPGLQQRLSAAALARVQHIGGWTQYGDSWEKLLREITGKQ